ncbi:SCO6745 family protein [Nocardia sp. CA-290969]|uniref:SCO6745 family protein n=1 Tax=Nocardia sp. CA-290969 TaxID=3239986 RepID=UPI003D8A3070
MSVGATVNRHIQELGGGFMFSREARTYAAETGIDEFFGPYTRGRGGVLGEVDADVVTAAFGFFPGHSVRTAWESVPMPAEKAAQRYAQACQEFGRRKLGAFEEAPRLAELLEAVAAAADPAGVPLFAGWRAMPLPADPGARVMQLAHVLRELRGGLHLLAVRASGITPLQAVLISGSPLNDGPGQARWYGWPEPFEEITDEVRAAWKQAEAVTDQLIAPAFAVLDDAAAADLVRLVAAAHAATFAR